MNKVALSVLLLLPICSLADSEVAKRAPLNGIQGLSNYQECLKLTKVVEDIEKSVDQSDVYNYDFERKLKTSTEVYNFSASVISNLLRIVLLNPKKDHTITSRVLHVSCNDTFNDI